MKDIKLFRRRFIPDETVLLKDDIIIHKDDDVIITKWKTLKPREDFTHGCSCFFLKKGYKVSKFINKDNKCIYYYCDIIETIFDESQNSYVFNDLLIDIVVYNDGFVKVLDLNEIPEALEKSLISVDLAKKALLIADELLNCIYSGNFEQLKEHFKIVNTSV